MFPRTGFRKRFLFIGVFFFVLLLLCEIIKRKKEVQSITKVNYNIVLNQEQIFINRHTGEKNKYQGRKSAFEKSLLQQHKQEQKSTDNKEYLTTKKPYIIFKQQNLTLYSHSAPFKMAFDIELVISSFKACHEGQLNLEEYNKGYRELYNFFNVLGTVFGFIASDVKEKIEVLNELRTNTENPNHSFYETVEKMMLHEIAVNKETGAALYGSRTLLRLHRALLFTQMFLERLGKMGDNDKVSTMASEVYGKSLANFHPWLIRKAASMAMYSLPNRKEMIKKIAPDGIEEEILKEKITECSTAIEIVYKGIEDLYTKHSLHDLP